MQRLKEIFTALCFTLTIPMLYIFYGILNNSGKGAHSLMTDLDRAIPFAKVFAIPYVAWYFFIFATLTYFCLKDREIYFKTLAALDISMIICYMIYFFYQTTVPRPQLMGNDIFTRIIGWVYTVDEPFNCFPSIHSLSSYLMIKGIRSSKVRNLFNQTVITGAALSIIASTFFIKQHVLLDAIGAIFLGEIVFNSILNWDKERGWIWERKPSLLWMTKKRLES